MSIFSTRLKELRYEAKISQQELSKIIGISKSSINMYERGEREPGLEMVKAFADYFDVKTDYLLGKTDVKRGLRIKDVMNRSMSNSVRLYRKRNGLTPKQFADMIGVDEAYVESLELEEIKPETSVLVKICDLLEAAPTIDVTNGEINLTPKRYLDLQLFAAPLPKDVRPIKTKKLPMLGNVACGEPIFAQESHESYVDADSDTDADFCLTAKGDSMINARIFDGDVLFVKSQPTVENGEIAVVLIEDEATVKRVYYDKENNVITLAPENPLYKPLRYEGPALDQIRILGKVVSGQYKI